MEHFIAYGGQPMMGNHVNGMQMEDKELPETRDTVRDQDALKAES